jgi:dolichol kinase
MGAGYFFFAAFFAAGFFAAFAAAGFFAAAFFLAGMSSSSIQRIVNDDNIIVPARPRATG